VPLSDEELGLVPKEVFWQGALRPDEAVELARIDRRIGFTCALKSGDRAVVEAVRRAGFVPTAEELGAVDWCSGWGWVNREGYLESIAELQPDWSLSSSAAAAIEQSGLPRARDLARQHHAPGF
jgi:hypothetical protein